MRRNPQAHDARAIANVLIRSGLDAGKPRDPLQVIKLTYLCHGWMLGLYERALSRQSVEAWRYGPVIPVVYHEVKRYGGKPITTELMDFHENFDELEYDLIDQVSKAYVRFSGIELSQLTHAKDTPWYIIWHDRGQNSEIPNDLIRDHFSDLAEQG